MKTDATCVLSKLLFAHSPARNDDDAEETRPQSGRLAAAVKPENA
jgi:hypothetical protein